MTIPGEIPEREKQIMAKYEKLRLSLRYWLIGREFYRAVEAMEFGAKHHHGTRKDGITPEFQHQIQIVHYLRTLPTLMYPEDTFAAAFLHDVTEDYGVALELIRERFGVRVASTVNLLDKNGKAEHLYFQEIALDPIASIVKGGDRMHNIQTMVGVFSKEKQGRYIGEVETRFFPMLKVARRLFVRQEAAYENIKHVLTSQIELLQAAA